jgi:hypothetical protein
VGKKVGVGLEAGELRWWKNAGSLTHTNGSAVVRIGDTAAVCGVRAEILHTKEHGIVRWHDHSRGLRAGCSLVEERGGQEGRRGVGGGQK